METILESNLINTTVLLHKFCQFSKQWCLYQGTPLYDEQLKSYMEKYTDTNLFIRIELDKKKAKLFIPIHKESIIGIFDIASSLIYKDHYGVRFIDQEELNVLLIQEHSCLNALWNPKPIMHNDGFQLSYPLTQISSQLAPIFTKYATATPQNASIILWLQRYLILLLKSYECLESKSTFPAIGDLTLILNKDAFPDQIVNGSSQQSPYKKLDLDQIIEQVFLDHYYPLCAYISRFSKIPESTLLENSSHVLKSLYGLQFKKNPLLEKLLTQKYFKIQLRSKTSITSPSCPNVLHEIFVEETLICPSSLDYCYARTFEANKIEIKIRPFDLDRDLPLVHEWFHRTHAKKIWQMDMSIQDLEKYYRTLLASRKGHSYIGEINGIPNFNFEVYWPIRDEVGNHYAVHPKDYGTHLFIATENKEHKFSSLTTQAMVDWVFSFDKVHRLIGEGSVESMAALLNKIHIGFKLKQIIEMPHKKANLNICYRAWFWERFPIYKKTNP